MESFLHTCLENAEKAGMSEGEYLRTCDALKKAFNTPADEFKKVRVNFSCNMKNNKGKMISIDIDEATLKKNGIGRYGLESIQMKIKHDMAGVPKNARTIIVKWNHLSEKIAILAEVLLPNTVVFKGEMGEFQMTDKQYLNIRQAEIKMFKEEGHDDEYDEGITDNHCFYSYISHTAYRLIINSTHHIE
jgi:hypothetical protein